MAIYSTNPSEDLLSVFLGEGEALLRLGPFVTALQLLCTQRGPPASPKNWD